MISRLRLRLMDLNCLGYAALVGLLVAVFRAHNPDWPVDLAVHVAWLLGILGLLSLAEARPAWRAVQTIRVLYPIACYAGGWLEIDHLGSILYGSTWATASLVRADVAIFGVHPTIWVQHLYSPWLDEIAAAFYSSYFVLPLLALYLLLRRRREELQATLGIVTLTYFTNYLFFYLFPALDPRMAPQLAGAPAAEYSGYVFGSLTRVLEYGGGPRGGCFPSSHVSGALAWCYSAWRTDRRLGLLMAPLVAGIALATVYLRYHHGVDPIAGLLLGAACCWLATLLLKRRREDPFPAG